MESSINSSYLPIWLIDLGTIVTIAGFILTIWLLIITGSIRRSFMSKARLPEIIEDLKVSFEKLSEHLKVKDWSTEKVYAATELSKIRALLENAADKLPDIEKKKCNIVIKKMTKKRWLFIRMSLSVLEEEQAWELYVDLNGIITVLTQFEQDSKWN